MPYIRKTRREFVDEAIDKVVGCLGICAQVGDVNYVVTRIIKEALIPDVSYQNINGAIGALECAKLEMYARLARPYEDKKAAENGDVYESVHCPGQPYPCIHEEKP